MHTPNTPVDRSDSPSAGWRTISQDVTRGLLWRLARARVVGIVMGPFIAAAVGLVMWGAAIVLALMWLR